MSNLVNCQDLLQENSQRASAIMRTRYAIFGVVTALVVACPSAAEAIALVTDRGFLAQSDRVDWSSLGIGTPFKILPNSFAATSEGGLGLDVNIPPTNNPRITQPFVFQSSPQIRTNFADGDFVLFTGFTPGQFPSIGNPGPITILFNNPVAAAGAQIAVDDTPNFVGFISAFDVNNNLLGSFSALGTSSFDLDNSALFLGVRNDVANISKLVFSSGEPQRAIGINTLSLSRTVVPESSSVVVLSLLGMGLLVIKRKKVLI